MIFIHMDKKETFTKTYHNKFISQNITLEIFTLYILKQNSHTKHQKHILISKACIIHIVVNLPQNLWPKVIKITSYIANKTLTKQNQWKMFFKIIIYWFPDFTHLHVYSCKIYFQINMLLKKQKFIRKHTLDTTYPIFIRFGTQIKTNSLKSKMFFLTKIHAIILQTSI